MRLLKSIQSPNTQRLGWSFGHIAAAAVTAHQSLRRVSRHSRGMSWETVYSTQVYVEFCQSDLVHICTS